MRLCRFANIEFCVSPVSESVIRSSKTLLECQSLLAVLLRRVLKNRNLVDPASSHMLVSKIKPCMSQHKYYKAKLRMAH